MTLDRPTRRHDLVVVCPTAWRRELVTRAELRALPYIVRWADNRWPLMSRRCLPGERHGMALGLPLPPLAGKRRLFFCMPPDAVVSIAGPPSLSVAGRHAPLAWTRTLDRLDRFAALHSVAASVFGSLAWQTLTGLDYLTERSDLDLLLHVQPDTDLNQLVAGLARIEHSAPMRIDCELVRDDGMAVNWREIHLGSRELLAKTLSGVRLLDAGHFLPGGPSP